MELTNKHKWFIVITIIAFIASAIFGYDLLKQGQKEDCWKKYENYGEQVAIQNCEGKE